MRNTALTSLVIFFVLVGNIQQAQAFWFKGNPNSEQKKGGKVEIELIYDNEAHVEFVPALIPFISKITDFLFKVIAKEIERESSKYSAEYSSKKRSNNFYNSSYDKISLKQIKITRYIEFLGNKDKQAFYAIFDVVPSNDNSAFYIQPNELKLIHSKAKVRQKDTNLDIAVKIIFDSVWLDTNNTIQTNSTSVDFLSNNIEFNKLNDFSSNDTNSVSTQWIPSIPRSAKFDNSGNLIGFGSGNYSVTVVVKEFDDFGKRLKELAEFIDKNREGVVGFISDQLN